MRAQLVLSCAGGKSNGAREATQSTVIPVNVVSVVI